MNYREKMREYLKEPNEICNHYGKWGILNKEQRDLITRLLNEMDGADNYIIKLQQENARLKDKIDKAVEYIKNIDKFEETLNDDTRIYMIQDADVDEIERILKEN